MATKYKIERDVPLPTDLRAGRACRFPFDELRVGDSFLVGRDEERSLCNTVNAYAKRHPGWRYITRKEGTGRRVWRISGGKS